MLIKPSSYWIRLAVKIAVPAFLLILIATQALAASGCKKVNGKFTLQPITGPECRSPVGLCAHGTFSGDLVGTSDFVGSSIIPSADTPTTAVIFVTGDTTFTTKSGDMLFTKDAISLRTTGDGEFGEVDTIVGGTGSRAGSTGALTATGTFTSAGGAGVYEGEVCTP
jgi:hypothetical protein